MRVATPLGEYPFQYRRLERRPEGVAIVGLVAGLEASMVFTTEDLTRLLKRLAPLVVAAALAVDLRRRRRAR
jgi:hypothetical protein